MVTLFGPDPVVEALRNALTLLADGGTVVEQRCLDLKEEAGRRGPGGVVLPGQAHNEAAAKALAGECACMANTPGGGALLVGVADDSTLIGTQLDAEWLRARIFELTQRQITVEARDVAVRGTRLLALRVVEAIEPVRWKGRITWRVADRCVEIDAATWHDRRSRGLLVDWSAQPSTVLTRAVRPQAVEIVRDFLRESVDPGANDLAEAPTPDLLRRLNAVTGDGFLTNAGYLVFVGRGAPAIDYIRREQAGADSTDRVRRAGVSLIEELQTVFSTARPHNPVVHVSQGLAVGQTRRIPERSFREVVVNGVAHRQWGVDDPTVVEHLGNSLKVTSPGAFFGGVTSENIINHPSRSRNTALTELLAAMRVAEREGIGVDRMVTDMLRLGYPRPDIRETPSPAVVATLIAETVDEGWMAWLNAFSDPGTARDLRRLMALDLLTRQGWIDLTGLAASLQVSEGEAQPVVDGLLHLTVEGTAVIVVVEGTPDGAPAAWALTSGARDVLDSTYGSLPPRRARLSRETVALGYARARGRISSTELGSLLETRPTNVRRVFQRLEEQELIEPSRPNRRGAGFYYVPTTRALGAWPDSPPGRAEVS
ncbi:ATP-binding protein [Promicromonospora sukumoe]